MPNDLMTDQDTSALEALSQVVTDLKDATRGYETMMDRAEDDLQPIANRLHALHTAHVAALSPHLKALGGDTDNEGSAMALVHSSVATVRDWFGALDQSALPQILDGEQLIVDSYTAAIVATDASSALSGLLEDQRAAVRQQIIALQA